VPLRRGDVQPRQRTLCDGLSSQIEFPLSGQEYQLPEEIWLPSTADGSVVHAGKVLGGGGGTDDVSMT